MLECLNFNRINLYEKQIIGQEAGEAVQRIRWKFSRRMKNFKRKLCCPHFLHIVSQDFKYFIDVDLQGAGFTIRDMKTEEEYKKIPEHLMNYWKKRPEDVLRGFKWIGNDILRIINTSGNEKLVDIGTDFNQIEFNFVHNYDHQLEQRGYFYYGRPVLPTTSVAERLIRKNQLYKSDQQMKRAEDPNHEYNLYNTMFSIDFQGSLAMKRWYSDLSFSYMGWRTIEQLRRKSLEIQDLDPEVLKEISFNILPMGQTCVHQLFNDPQKIEFMY